MSVNALEKTESLIRGWERIRKRTRDPARKRLASRVLRTLSRRHAMLADRTDLDRSVDANRAAGSNTPGDV
jgi:hypothetical protein